MRVLIFFRNLAELSWNIEGIDMRVVETTAIEQSESRQLVSCRLKVKSSYAAPEAFASSAVESTLHLEELIVDHLDSVATLPDMLALRLLVLTVARLENIEVLCLHCILFTRAFLNCLWGKQLF